MDARRGDWSKPMDEIKAVSSAVLVLALAVIVGVHLALLWTSGGQLLISESSRALPVIESVTAAGIFVFGIERLVAALRAHKSRPED